MKTIRAFVIRYGIAVVIFDWPLAGAEKALASDGPPMSATISPPSTTMTGLPAPQAAERTTVPLELKWNEREHPFTVPVENKTNAAQHVVGVQVTSNIFVVSVPAEIPAHGKAEIALLYVTPTVERGGEVVRVRTSVGDRTIMIARRRESVVTMDVPQLRWEIGEAPRPKVVSVTVDTAKFKGAKLVKLRAPENFAKLKELGNDRYTVEVTPLSTTTPSRITVSFVFEPELPGSAATIEVIVAPPALTPLSPPSGIPTK